MFTHNLKSAFRNMWKRKSVTVLNLLGLAIGMAACLLIYQYISFELSYDQFHHDVDRIYRLDLGMQKGEEGGVRASNHPAAGPAIKRDFPQVEEFTRVVEVSVLAGASVLGYTDEEGKESAYYEDKMYMVDSTFLRIFNYPLVAGDAYSALVEPQTMVISEKMAKKHFGDKDPIGETMDVNGRFSFTITGILKNLPANSHQKIEALFSISTLPERMGLDNTWVWPEYFTYLKLAPKTQVASLESQLEGFVNKYLSEVMDEYGLVETMSLTALTDIHLYSHLRHEMEENSNAQTISFLSLIALLILIIAWVNYINLSTARSIERSSEVGLRKVVGAGKKHLISQFLLESALMNFLAIVLAVMIVQLTLPAFNQLVGSQMQLADNGLAVWQSGDIWLAILLIFLGGTFLAGLYPAFVLSSFNPVSTLKGKVYRSGSKFNFRQVLVVFQFAVSIFLIIGTLVVSEQLSFMRNQDLGFNMDQILVLKSPSVTDSTYIEKADILKQRLLREPSISYFTASSAIPGRNGTGNAIKLKDTPTDEAQAGGQVYVDEDFLATYEIEIVAGRDFSKDMATDRHAVILNERQAKNLGFTTPEEALNKELSHRYGRGWDDVKVIGVCKDIHHSSLQYEQSPLAFFFKEFPWVDYYSIKVQPQNIPETISQIQTSFHSLFPRNPFEYFFLDDDFAKQYEADQRFGKIFGLFAGLAIFVACLGLLGLAAYIAAQRTKEIGIRKVLGASTNQILALLSRQFVILVLIASVIAIPIAVWGAQKWLEDYAYTMDLSLWLFAVPVLLVILIAIGTVVWQTLKTAKANPIEALKYE